MLYWIFLKKIIVKYYELYLPRGAYRNTHTYTHKGGWITSTEYYRKFDWPFLLCELCSIVCACLSDFIILLLLLLLYSTPLAGYFYFSISVREMCVEWTENNSTNKRKSCECVIDRNSTQFKREKKSEKKVVGKWRNSCPMSCNWWNNGKIKQ